MVKDILDLVHGIVVALQICGLVPVARTASSRLPSALPAGETLFSDRPGLGRRTALAKPPTRFRLGLLRPPKTETARSWRAARSIGRQGYLLWTVLTSDVII